MRLSNLVAALAVSALGTAEPAATPSAASHVPEVATVRPLYALDYKVSRKTDKGEVVMVAQTAYLEEGHVTAFETREAHSSEAIGLTLKINSREDHRIAIEAKWDEVSHQGDKIEWKPELQVHSLGEPTTAKVNWAAGDGRIITVTLR